MLYKSKTIWPLATHRGRLAPQKRPKKVAICRLLTYERQEKIAKERRVINSDMLSRDYSDVPSIINCPRCGSKAHVTTSVSIPSILSEPGKLEFNKFDIRIYHSVHCNSCSLGTGNREEMAEVMRDWNSQKMIER